MRKQLRLGMFALGLAALLCVNGCGGTLNDNHALVGSAPLNDGSGAFLSRLAATSTGVGERSVAGGRYLVFHSQAALTPEDTNQVADVYRHDFRLGKTSLISVSADLGSGDGPSTQARITRDGRYVVFQSAASDLVEGDGNGVEDIFVRDLFRQSTIRVNPGPGAAEANAASHSPSISDDGRFVVFCSTASNLVSGDDNGFQDIFLHDLVSGSTTLMSTGTEGGAASGPSFEPTITPDGSLLAFSTEASDIGGSTVRQIVRQRRDGTERALVTQTLNGEPSQEPCYAPSMSDDGNLIAFFSQGNLTSEGNGRFQVFLRDLREQAISVISLDANGELGNDHSGFARLSGDGSSVVFSSLASNLVRPDDNGVMDVFSAPSGGGAARLLSRGLQGEAANDESDLAVVSHDGSLVAFRSRAANLVATATTDREEIFLRSEVGGKTRRISSTFEPSGLWPGFGEPQFTQTATLVGSRPFSLALADFNGDTILDFVSGSTPFDFELHRKDGTGDGRFVDGQPISVTVPNFASFLLAEDFINVGPVSQPFASAIDIWVSYSPFPVESSSFVYPNLGLGEFDDPRAVLLDPSLSLFYGATDDFNLDGRADIAAIRGPDDPRGLLLLGAEGTLAIDFEEFDSGNSGLASGDLDRNANPDVVTTDSGTGEVVVALVDSSLGTAPVFSTARYEAGGGAKSPVVLDFNRDGRLDVAALTSGGLVILNGRGNGTLAAPTIVSDLQGGPMAGGDLNRDGKVDLVTVDFEDVYVLLGRGDGTFEEVETYPSISTFAQAQALHLADLDSDGDLDVVTLTDGGFQFPLGGVVVLLNQAR